MSGARLDSSDPASSDPAVRDLYWKPWDAPGCEHVRVSLDIAVTPFTNTLPIRRLGLAAGEIADIRAVYLPLPGLAPVPAEQSYACLRPLGLSGGLYRYQSRSSGFSTDLAVDSGGFVVDYPDSFRRIW